VGLIYLFIPISDLILYFNQEKFFAGHDVRLVKVHIQRELPHVRPAYKFIYNNEIKDFKNKVVDY
jgi:hypothetical protein